MFASPAAIANIMSGNAPKMPSGLFGQLFQRMGQQPYSPYQNAVNNYWAPDLEQVLQDPSRWDWQGKEPWNMKIGDPSGQPPAKFPFPPGNLMYHLMGSFGQGQSNPAQATDQGPNAWGGWTPQGGFGSAPGFMDPNKYANAQGPLLANQDGTPIQQKQQSGNAWPELSQETKDKMRF